MIKPVGMGNIDSTGKVVRVANFNYRSILQTIFYVGAEKRRSGPELQFEV